MRAAQQAVSDRLTRTLRAATDRILPPEPGPWPGAAEVNVVGYLRWRLGQADSAAARSALEAGVELLDQIAMVSSGTSFAQCDAAAQDAALRVLQRLPHPRAQRFVRMLVNMTLAGFFGDPRYGGNRSGSIWRLIGFRPDPVTGRASTRRRRV